MLEVVASLLLALPVAPVTPPPPLDPVRPPTAIQSFFIVREVMGRGECDGWLNPDRPDVFWSDLAMLVARWSRVHAYPPLSDAALLPPPGVAADYLAFNSEHAAWLEKRMDWELDRQGETRAWRAENEALRTIWQCVATAACEGYGPEWRREALNTLRKRLGPEDYYQGRLPPPVPVWRFSEVPCGSPASVVNPRRP
jgi:hypothetical protein